MDVLEVRNLRKTCEAQDSEGAPVRALRGVGVLMRESECIAIARALANEPTLVLADEPTGALDSAGGEEVMELFRRLHNDGQAIMLVTHDAEVAAAADRIVQMRDGKVEGEPVPASVGATPEPAYGVLENPTQ